MRTIPELYACSWEKIRDRHHSGADDTDGIVDAALVAVSALQAATSVATLLLTTEVVVAKPAALPRPTRADDIPFGPEAKDMTADEAGEFGLV